ncbi:Gastrula zinc finger [Paramuricea clavata]|uniref:Gastrula zinc finger n=1 Tax=Paramuricea clavata TaxID=317549 RepID=A0A7D9L787_PARCT|nr:Gastrula zinc finger [Paramuricea clavata]
MAGNFNMNEFSVEQLLALNSIIDSDEDMDTRVEGILEDRNYRITPDDKGESPFQGERQFVDEVDRDMETKKPRRIPKNYKGRRGIMPTWKYSDRQKAKALLVEEAYQSLLSKGVQGLPPTMGGRWRTDDVLVNEEIKRIENERNPKEKRPRGSPPKAKVDAEVKVPKKRGRPPKAKTDTEAKVPKKRGRPPKVKTDVKVRKQTVSERFLSQRKVKLSVPADSVITPTGPGKFTIHVDLNKRPVRKAPEVPKGVAPWRPIPKPRTVLPRERPVPKPRTKLLKERTVPKPRTRKPVSPPKVRKPVRVSREVKEQPIVVTPEEQEIDPFGTDLEKPFHRKIETAANGAAVTYSITPHYMDPLDQMTASRQVVRGILVNELKRMGGLKYTETLKVRMSKEIGDGKTKKDSIYFKSKTGTATNFEDIESTAAQNQLTILSRIETFQNLGSNWIILNIESHYVNIAIHVRHLNPKARRATTITQKDREFITNLDYDGIDFRVKISDIDRIERKNSISISVFGYKGKKQFYPIRNSNAKYEDHMELLLLGDGEVALARRYWRSIRKHVWSTEERKEKSENPEEESSTDLYQTHKACSFGLKTVCHYDDKYSGEYKSCVGSDAALVFLKTVVKESFRCREMTDKIFRKKMVITLKEEAEFLVTRNCHIYICGYDLCEDRVRDHDHVAGKYRGAAHNICNLKYRITWKVPVVFHNLRGYDSHLIMQEIGKFKMDVNVIPNNMEKYISFSLGKNLVFIDSIQFMASSLEALVSNLSPEDFRIVGKKWKGEDFNLVTQKGVFPYELLDDISKLNTEGLPSKDKFYSPLYESEVKEEDYQ